MLHQRVSLIYQHFFEQQRDNILHHKELTSLFLGKKKIIINYQKNKKTIDNNTS